MISQTNNNAKIALRDKYEHKISNLSERGGGERMRESESERVRTKDTERRESGGERGGERGQGRGRAERERFEACQK